MNRYTWWLAGGLMVAAGGCDGDAEVDGTGGSTSGTGGTASGTGGAGGTGGDVGGAGGSTSSTSGQAGAGGGEACGGPNDIPCGQDEFCDLPDGANCEGEGNCEPLPEDCNEDCPGVCGCDQQFYCNGCIANAAGVEVSDDTGCLPGQASYAAQAMPGGLDRIFIMKQNDSDGRCIRLVLVSPMTGTYNVTTPAGWTVETISAYNSTTECLNANQSPPGTPEQAASATGTISWTLDPNHYYPCQLNIAATATFTNPPGWLDANVGLQATNLAVAGCT